MLYALIVILMKQPYSISSIGYYDDLQACQRAGEQIRSTYMEIPASIQYLCTPTKTETDQDNE